MFKLVYTNKFRRDIKLLQRRSYNMDTIKQAIVMLEENGKLPTEYRPHKLFGGYAGYWEAHLKPDWLIIWKIIPEQQEIWLARTGTHADLF